ncbi:hypothetical protein HPB50_004752 [Hyalomma asiaticum]|uniref:Uncharacterized protein n=1 Tax=Hyalomma asiaticum TaxID=266040 RepID=A0ACB7TCF0_HYAAI|nr:hypothetical protein HPB50_004752 [Hyalomma asiaticum]
MPNRPFSREASAHARRKCTRGATSSERPKYFWWLTPLTAGQERARVWLYCTTKRNKWVKAMRRVNADGSPWEPSAYSRVCSDHFETGAPSRFMTHPDYVPSIFKHTANFKISRSNWVSWQQCSRISSCIEDPTEQRRKQKCCTTGSTASCPSI